MNITEQFILIPNVLQARIGKMNNSTQAAQTTQHNRKTGEYEEGVGGECEGVEGGDGKQSTANGHHWEWGGNH